MRLRKALWPDCPSERHTLEMNTILSSQGLVLVAEAIDSTLVGFAEVSIRRDHVDGAGQTPVPYLEGWFVDPGHRAKGIGKALIKALEKTLLQRGYKELASDAEVINSSGIIIHKRLGFKEVGRSVHFIKRL